MGVLCRPVVTTNLRRQCLLLPRAAAGSTFTGSITMGGWVGGWRQQYPLLPSHPLESVTGNYSLPQHAFTVIEAQLERMLAHPRWVARYRHVASSIPALQCYVVRVILYEIGAVEEDADIEPRLRNGLAIHNHCVGEVAHYWHRLHTGPRHSVRLVIRRLEDLNQGSLQ